MEDANHEFDSMGDTKQLAVVKEDPFLESFVFRPVDDEWFNSLENFTKLNESRFSIASTYGNHPKGHLIKTIADLLQSPQPDAVLLILLKGARICSRDEVLLDPFYERAFIQRIMQFAGLLPSLSPSPVTENIEVLIEARKSLVNILAKSSKAAHQAFLDLDGPQSCMAAIQHLSIKSTEAFPLLRIVANLTSPTDSSAQVSLFSVPEFHNQLYELLQQASNELEQIPAVAVNPLPPMLSQALQEILKVLFNITIDLGPLAHGAAQRMTEDDYRRDYLHHHLALVRLLFVGLSSRDRREELNSSYPLYYDVRLRVMNCLVNIPSIGWSTILNSDPFLLPLILDMATVNLQFSIPDLQISQHLVPISMVLAQIATHAPSSRTPILRFLVPGWSAYLLAALLDINFAHRFYCRELFHQLGEPELLKYVQDLADGDEHALREQKEAGIPFPDFHSQFHHA